MKIAQTVFIRPPGGIHKICLGFSVFFLQLFSLLCGNTVILPCSAQVVVGTERSTAKPHALLNVPLDDPMVSEVYDFVDRVSLKYQLKGLLKNRRPYSQGDVTKLLNQLREGNFPLTEIEQERLNRLIRFLANESPLLQSEGHDYRFGLNFEFGQITTHQTKPANPSGTEFGTQLRPIVSGGVGDDFVMLTDFRYYLISGMQLLDTLRLETDYDISGLKLSSAGTVPAYAKFKLRWFELMLGKDNISWGPGRRGNLLVSANPLPTDMIQIKAQYGGVGFNAFTAILRSEVDSKYISAHRLDFDLWGKGSLGIAESLVFGRRFEVRYLNPLTIYLASELNTETVINGQREISPDNTSISGTLDLHLIPNVEFYGELLIDDFVANYGLASFRNWGSKLGIQLGGYWVDPGAMRNTELRLEYTFINQFAYTHRFSINQYTHFDRLIGHEIGSDAGDFWVNFRYWLTDTLSGALTYELEWHGEGDVAIPHSAGAPSDDQWEFLSGTRESTHAFSVEGRYHAVGDFLLKGQYTFSHITNFSHHKGIGDNQHELVLTALYRL